MPKKKFIDKKSSVTFHLVHRSQKDPLIADDKAPQHVLLAVGDKQKGGIPEKEKQKEEQRKFGVFFDDDYNYLQHLRQADKESTEWEPEERFVIPRQDPKLSDLKAPLPPHTLSEDSNKIQLPSSVFASSVEEDVGLLNRAAPESGLRLDLDPDIVAAMDDDFDFDDPENELEDNFMEIANASGEEDDENENSDISSDGGWTDASGDGEGDDEVMSLNGPQFSFTGEETKSRFTEYSMSSSVIRRNENLSLLDSRFEHMFTDYDDTEIGALDCDEIEGPLAPNSQLVLQYADEFKKAKEKAALETGKRARVMETTMDSDTNSDDDLVNLNVTARERKKWDCESVLTSRSNLYNHPKLISEPRKPVPIRVSSKTGVPIGVLSERRGLTARALAMLDSETGVKSQDEDASVALSVLSTLSIRPKGESSQERIERKHALKDYRKERRLERKANKLAFKEEKKKQEKLVLHNRNCANTVKIV